MRWTPSMTICCSWVTPVLPVPGVGWAQATVSPALNATIARDARAVTPFAFDASHEKSSRGAGAIGRASLTLERFTAA